MKPKSPIVTIGIELVRRAMWFPLALFVVNIFLSYVLFAYSYFPRLDRPMHVLGGIAIAYSVWRGIDVLVNSGFLERVQPALLAVLVFALTSTAAVFWEFSQFVSDYTIGTNSQVGLNDTLIDMLLGIIGGLVYLGWKGILAPDK